MDSNQTRVVIVDDHHLIRQGINSILERSGRFNIVGEGSVGEHIQQLVEKLRPDILITDLHMPAYQDVSKTAVFDPLFTLEKIRQKYPQTMILVVSQHHDVHTIQFLARLGIEGYMLKTDNFSQELDIAVGLLLRGGTYFSPDVRELIVSRRLPESKTRLTARQLEILQAIVNQPDKTREELAALLNISPSTLQKHITAIFDALGVSNMAACIIKAMRLQYVPLYSS